MKKCFVCKKFLPTEAFWTHLQKKDLLHPSCKVCSGIMGSNTYERNSTKPCSRCRRNKRAHHSSWCYECRNNAAKARRVKNRGRWYASRTQTQKIKLQARKSLSLAVRLGKIVKAPCEVCGKLESHGHHHNGYGKEHWLDVRWFCLEHHHAMERWKRMKLTLGQPCAI